MSSEFKWSTTVLICHRNKKNATEIVLLSRKMSSVVLFSILDATATFSNSCVLVMVLRKTCLRTVSNLLVVALALNELLTAVLVIPFSIAAFAKELWQYGEGFCLFQGYLGNMLSLSSAVFTSVIAVDRFYTVSSPISHAGNVTGRHIVATTIVVFLQAAFWSIFPLLGIGNLRYDFISAKLRCALRWDLHGNYLIYYFLITTVGFVVPAFTIILMHYKSFKEARRSARQIRPGHIRVQVLKDGQYTTVAQRNNSNNFKANITLIVIIGTFLVSRGPLAIVNIINGVHGGHYFSDTTELVFSWLLYFATLLNPYIYTLLNRRLRREIVQTVSSWFKRKKEEDEEPKDLLDYLRNITENHVSTSPSVASVLPTSPPSSLNPLEIEVIKDNELGPESEQGRHEMSPSEPNNN